MYKIFVALLDDSIPTLSPSMPPFSQLKGSPVQQRIVSSSSSSHKGTEFSTWCMQCIDVPLMLYWSLNYCNKSTAGYVLIILYLLILSMIFHDSH